MLLIYERHWSERFFVFLVVGNMLVGLFALYRMSIRPVIENKDNQFFPVPKSITPTGMELNPAANTEEDNKI